MATKSKKTNSVKNEVKNEVTEINSINDYVAEMLSLSERLSESLLNELAEKDNCVTDSDAMNILDALPVRFLFNYRNPKIENVAVDLADWFRRFHKASKYNESLLSETENVDKSGKAKNLGHNVLEEKYNSDAMKGKRKANTKKHDAYAFSYNGTNKALEGYVKSVKAVSVYDMERG